MKRLFTMLLILALLLAADAALASSLRVDFYDMGKADAMLITTPDNTRILIDCSTGKGGKALVSRFEREGIRRIDTLIITHFDKDHIGGADKILESLSVGQVILPVYEKESKQHTQLMDALSAQPEISVCPLPIGDAMSLKGEDGAMLSITAAHRESYGVDEENDFSLAVRLTYGKTRFLFPGDAEAPRQQELLDEGDIACDVLKVPYHGRLVSVSERFLTQTKPKIAYITDSEEDPANESLVTLLNELGTQVFTSREHGDVSVVSDGESVRIL